MNPQMHVTLIDAAMAERLLAGNTRNRPIAETVVRRYQLDMEAGNWQYTADPIRFADDGMLLDGQHRLHALARTTNVTLPFLVIRGLPKDTQMVMDQGRKRTPGQQLGLLGIKDYNVVAAGVKLHLIRETGHLFRDHHEALTVATTAAIEKWVAENTPIVDGLSELTARMRSCDAPPSVMYAAGIAFWQLSPILCDEFFHLLAAGAGEGHPINTLDKRLQRDRRSRIKVSQRELLGMFFHTWNLWREGKRTTKLQRPSGGTYTAKTFPELVSA